MIEPSVSAIQPFLDQARPLLSDRGFVVLFGSRARGDAGPNSDYDLAVVDTAIASDLELRLKLRDLSQAVDARIDLHPYSIEDLHALLQAQLVGGRRAGWWNNLGGGSLTGVLELHIVHVGHCILGDESQLRAWKSEVESSEAPPIAPFRTAIDLRDGLLDEERVILSEAQRCIPYDGEFRKTAYLLGHVQFPVRGCSETWLMRCIQAALRPDLARCPLFAGRGNFGSIYGDPAAAPRYTELRMNPVLHSHMIGLRSPFDDNGAPTLGLDHDEIPTSWKTRRSERSPRDYVKWKREMAARLVAEADALEASLNEEAANAAAGSEREGGGSTERALPPVPPFGTPLGSPPLVLFPHRLVNGSVGLEPFEATVGIEGRFPSHGLDGVVSSLLALSTNERTSDEQLLDLIDLPDFARGGVLTDADEARGAQYSGSGSFEVEAVLDSYERDGVPILALRELPPSVSGHTVLVELRQARSSGQLTQIASIENHSSHRGLRVEFHLQRGTDAKAAREGLFESTSLATRFEVDMYGEEERQTSRTSVPDLLRRVSAFQLDSLGSTKDVGEALQQLRRYADPRRTSVRRA